MFSLANSVAAEEALQPKFILRQKNFRNMELDFSRLLLVLAKWRSCGSWRTRQSGRNAVIEVRSAASWNTVVTPDQLWIGKRGNFCVSKD
jgi:hypothetical protein